MSSLTDFLRKNAVLVVVIALTAVAVIVLGSLAIVEWSKVQGAMEKINQDKAAVGQINAKRNPNPVDGSARMIQEDTVRLTAETRKLQRNFGKPYRGALLSFLGNMEAKSAVPAEPAAAVAVEQDASAKDEKAAKTDVPETAKDAAPVKAEASAASDDLQIPFSEDEVYDIFAKIYKDYHAARKNASSAAGGSIVSENAELFEKVRAALTAPRSDDEMNEEQAKAYTARAEAKFDKCFAQFTKDVSAITCEKIDGKAAKDIFLQALGLPRTMTTWDCKRYVDELHKNMGAAGIIPGINAENFEQNIDKVRALTYDLKGKAPASQDNVVPIIRRFQMLEDMYRRMTDAKITSLKSVKPLNGLFGEPENSRLKGQFLVFTYEVTFTSPLPETRDFINRLRSASDDVSNRVYLIRSFVVTKADVEEVKRAGSQEPIDERALNASADQEGAEASDVVKANPDDYVNAPDYGRPVIGVNDLVNVKIAFDYLVYIGDEVGGKH